MIYNLSIKTKNILIKITLGFLIVSFIITGIGKYIITNNTNYVAIVNGQKISFIQLEQILQSEVNYQQEYMNKNPSELSNNKNYIRQMRHQILLRLVDETLLNQYAHKLGLIISDHQIKKIIFSTPAFHTNNKFDNNKFLALINNLGLSLSQYTKILHKQLLIQQLFSSINNTEFLLPLEINRLIALTSQIRGVRLAVFKTSTLIPQQTVSDDEIQVNYNINKSRYLLPETFKVRFIKINTKNIYKNIKVNKQEIKSWYEKYQDQFIVPASKRYSIIQSKTENDAKYCLKQLQQGANFASLAKSYSVDIISSKNGGDIGWINDIDSFDELNQANLSKKGQLSNVIRSSVGFIIIRLDDYIPAQIKPLKLVYKDIAIKIKNKKVIDAYYDLKQKIINAINNDNNHTLLQNKTVAGIKVQETNWFDKNNIPKVINYDAVKKVLFEKKSVGINGIINKNSGIIDVNNNQAFVVSIIDYLPEHFKSLEDVRSSIEEEVKYKKSIDQIYKNTKKWIDILNKNHDKNTEKIFQQETGVNFSTIKYFKSNNQRDVLTQTIFSLPRPKKGKSNYSIATNKYGNIVIIALDRIKPSVVNEQQRKILINYLNQTMASITFNTLINSLRSNAKIVISSDTI